MRMKLAPWPQPPTWLVEHQDRDVKVTVCGPGGLTLVSGLTRIGSAIDSRPGEDAPLLLLAMYGGLSLWIDFRQMLGVTFSEPASCSSRSRAKCFTSWDRQKMLRPCLACGRLVTSGSRCRHRERRGPRQTRGRGSGWNASRFPPPCSPPQVDGANDAAGSGS
jgi:hypothetical protein